LSSVTIQLTIPTPYHSTCLVLRDSDTAGTTARLRRSAKRFAIRDARVRKIAQMVHHADLDDEKFGRIEAKGLDQVLNGWAGQGVADAELLRRGIDMIEGLYQGLN